MMTKETKVNKITAIKAGFLNATSLTRHMWMFRQYPLNNSSFHFFGIAETRLGPTVPDSVVDIPGYSVLRQDRNTGGGGILLFVRNNLKAKVLHRSSTTQSGKPLKPEYLFCKVWEGNSPPIFVAVIYKPPDVPLKTDRRLLSTLRSCCSEYSHKVIMGDWNVDMSNTQNWNWNWRNCP